MSIKQTNRKQIQGNNLMVAASIGNDYAKAINALLSEMHKDVMYGVRNISAAYAEDALFGGVGDKSRAQQLFDYLMDKYSPLIDYVVKRAIHRMTDRVLKNSSRTLNASLRDMAEHLAIDPPHMTARLKEITTAAAEESSALISVIPQRYLQDVKIALLRSVGTQGGTRGKGIADLVPILTKLYKGNKRQATLTALDQTRKLYNTVQAQRMQDAGITEFMWIHSGGGRDPRKEHQAMNGNVYRLDDPPVIYVDKGVSVHGLPGQAINCRCVMRPVLNFKD